MCCGTNDLVDCSTSMKYFLSPETLLFYLQRGRGREVVQTQDTNLRHCRSHEQHDTCQLESMVYVKQSQNKASAKNKR